MTALLVLFFRAMDLTWLPVPTFCSFRKAVLPVFSVALPCNFIHVGLFWATAHLALQSPPSVLKVGSKLANKS